MKKITFKLLLILCASCGSNYTSKEDFNFTEFVNDSDEMEEIYEFAVEKGLRHPFDADTSFYIQDLGWTSTNCKIQSPLFYVYAKWKGTKKVQKEQLYVDKRGDVRNNFHTETVDYEYFGRRLFYYYNGELTQWGYPYKEDYDIVGREMRKDSNSIAGFYGKKIAEVYAIATKKTAKSKFFEYEEDKSYADMDQEIKEYEELKNIFKKSKNKIIEVKINNWNIKTKNIFCLFDKWLEHIDYNPISQKTPSYIKRKEQYEMTVAKNEKSANTKLEYLHCVEQVANLCEKYKEKYGQYPENGYVLKDKLNTLINDDSTYTKYFNFIEREWKINFQQRRKNLNDQCMPIIDPELKYKKNYLSVSGVSFKDYYTMFNYDLPKKFKNIEDIVKAEEVIDGTGAEGNSMNLLLTYVHDLKSWVFHFDKQNFIFTDCNKNNLVTFKELPAGLPSGKKYKKIIDPDRFGWLKLTLKTSEELMNDAQSQASQDI